MKLITNKYNTEMQIYPNYANCESKPIPPPQMRRGIKGEVLINNFHHPTFILPSSEGRRLEIGVILKN